MPGMNTMDQTNVPHLLHYKSSKYKVVPACLAARDWSVWSLWKCGQMAIWAEKSEMWAIPLFPIFPQQQT